MVRIAGAGSEQAAGRGDFALGVIPRDSNLTFILDEVVPEEVGLHVVLSDGTETSVPACEAVTMTEMVKALVAAFDGDLSGTLVQLPGAGHDEWIDIDEPFKPSVLLEFAKQVAADMPVWLNTPEPKSVGALCVVLPEGVVQRTANGDGGRERERAGQGEDEDEGEGEVATSLCVPILERMPSPLADTLVRALSLTLDRVSSFSSGERPRSTPRCTPRWSR
uniref:Uncharacterized protein n=1 Tax=Haptolina brevifila TaxID=156173 RepID=A0A7S2FL34_9EUKA|mmetsp:Transcript_14766/g.29650  ORF Transcript_14766/g.29650 Transcript_14766/m.29650 type:complete len:221 (+) Transcript_14766:264-926(+)